MGLLERLLGQVLGSAIDTAISYKRQQDDGFMNEKQMELNIQKETLLALGSNKQMANPGQSRAVEAILNDYPDFDASYAISCAQTFSEMLADAFRSRPKDEYKSFLKICDEKATNKIKRFIAVKRIPWYEKSVSTPEITRYNPQPPNPHIMLKVRLQFTPADPDYPNGQIYFICMSCFEGAFVCDHCGGIVEDENATSCPFCDCAVTKDATERAWKITDVRRF